MNGWKTARQKTKRHLNFLFTSHLGKDAESALIKFSKVLKKTLLVTKNVIPIQFTSSRLYMLPPFTDRVAERPTTGGEREVKILQTILKHYDLPQNKSKTSKEKGICLESTLTEGVVLLCNFHINSQLPFKTTENHPVILHNSERS